MKCYTCGSEYRITMVKGKAYCFQCEVDVSMEQYRISSSNQREEGIMIEERLLKKNIRLTPKGRRWADNFEAILFYVVILLAFGIVGSIETGRWF
jgi:hypothetical protein